LGASVGAGSDAPQAARDRTMTRASSIAISFFIVFPPKIFAFILTGLSGQALI
jgi:hypothetical protein